MDPIGFLQFLQVAFLCVVWSTLIGAIIEGIKKAVDTEVDPDTKEGVEIIAETVRGRPPVTPELMESITSGQVSLIDDANEAPDFNVKVHRDTTGKEIKYYRRPVWFRRLLPLLPILVGMLSGPLVFGFILFMAGIILPTQDVETWYGIAGFTGLGAGSMSGSFYKARTVRAGRTGS